MPGYANDTCSKRMPLRQPLRHRARRRFRSATPRSPRATRAAASRPSRCRAGSRFRRPSRRCTPRAASRPRARAAPGRRCRCSPDETNTIAPMYAAPKIAQPSACHNALLDARRADRAVPALPRRAAHLDEPLADARDAHFLAGRRGGRGLEQVARQPICRGAALLGRAFDRRAATSTSAPSAARTARSSTSDQWIDISSTTVTPRRRIQPHVENSDMYMWSSTNT